MSNWEQDVAELKAGNSATRTDIKYIREDNMIMQKQIRDLNRASNIGAGFLKATIYIGGILGAIYTFFKIMD